ncbi:hypothetical protein [Clostridium liquoris]|uniref:hypothetical protein n=1 Tax=Clostridium liquoris TaxID=1289519 RepID=UPI000D031263|nr:hypothetical protein [Clostridium liquoris]
MIKIKYTRYDLKRKKKDSFLFFIIVILILIISLILGSLFSKIFMKDALTKTSPNIKETPYVEKSQPKPENMKNNKVIIPSKGKTIKYVAIQEGIYQNDAYLKESIKKLEDFGAPFIIPEGNGKRVLLGIYGEEDSANIIKRLNDKKIENSKMVFTIKCEDVCDLEIVEIINAYIQVLGKLSEKNVKAIETKELKSWCASLEEVQINNKNIKLLNELKDRINKLPDKVTRDKASENYIFLYNLLRRLV